MEKIRKGFITFGEDEVSTFKGAKFGATIYLVNKHIHFMISTNLVVQTFSDFVVNHVEEMLATLYSYFNSSSKHTPLFQKLTTCLESKGNKILRM